MGLFSAIRQIADTATMSPKTGDPSHPGTPSHSRYHRWIVVVSLFFAAFGAVLGLMSSVALATDTMSERSGRVALLAPLMFAVGGFAFGMSVMCLVAPREFLTGPVGRPWMKLIGTRSVGVARIACLLFGLIVTLPVVGIGVLIARQP